MTESDCIKRKSRYFLSYISPVLKNICDKSGISKDAKIHLNKSFIIIAQNISNMTLQITVNNKRKTVTKKTLLSTIQLFLIGDLYKNSLEEADKALYNFNNNNTSSKRSRQKKACIIFPPFLCEKFLRGINNNQLKISKEVPIIFAVILEYICSQILECVRDNLYNEKRSRFQTRDIDLAIKNDDELSYLFKKNGIKFIKGILIPFVHPKILLHIEKQIPNKKKKKKNVISLKNIKKLQRKSYNLTLCKKPFINFVKTILNTQFGEDIRLSKELYTMLQYLIEKYVIEIFFKAYLLTLHSDRINLSKNDIIFITKIGNDMHYIKNNFDILNSPDEDESELV